MRDARYEIRGTERNSPHICVSWRRTELNTTGDMEKLASASEKSLRLTVGHARGGQVLKG